MRRVPEVIDVWFDSGSMPFAQRHAPFENEERFRETFPADYICEAIDQTRGWFYSLIAISTLLFDRAPYRTVLCLGHIADPQGKKMSKSLGNIVVPWEVIQRHGADAFRWYYLDVQAAVGRIPVLDRDRRRVGAPVPAAALEHVRLLRALRERERDHRRRGEPETELDRWAISRLNATIAEVRDRMEDYDATRAGQAIAAFVDELSNWYVRRSRRRFWDGDPAAFGTLKHALVEVAKLLAPFTPFVADAIFENLDGGLPSVHLADFPERRAARPRARDRDGRGARDGPARPGGARARQAQGAPAAARRRRRGGRRASARRSSGSRRRRARRAQRQGAALRQRGRRARLLRGQAELPRARPALRQDDAAGRGRGRRARSRARRDVAARRRPRRHQRGRPRPRARARRPHARPAAARRATSSSARARTRSRSSSSSTRSCAARASRARSSTRSRTRARAPGCRSRTGSSSRSAATTSCSPPPATTRTTWPRRRSRSSSPSTARRAPPTRSSTAARCTSSSSAPSRGSGRSRRSARRRRARRARHPPRRRGRRPRRRRPGPSAHR